MDSLGNHPRNQPGGDHACQQHTFYRDNYSPHPSNVSYRNNEGTGPPVSHSRQNYTFGVYTGRLFVRSTDGSVYDLNKPSSSCHEKPKAKELNPVVFRDIFI
ncbi:hypothetical protein HMPREF9374_2957 [Desmospora sp. 8437]|nr:hypothetical protein HMPREF9374_2957 [Desmospora sp. 8437]